MPSGVVHARTRNVSKTSNEHAETIVVRRAASSVAIFIKEILVCSDVINVRARKIRRSIEKRSREIQKREVTRLTVSKNEITLKSMIRKNLPGAKWSTIEFAFGMASHWCGRRTSPKQRQCALPLSIPVAINNTDEWPAMSNDCAILCRTLPQLRRDRQFLPADRQSMPRKILKYQKKGAPEFLSGIVQRLEAVWNERIRHCGFGD